MKTLKKNSRGEEVKTLQKRLNLYADGIFGKLTEEAVREFQRSNGLVADGIVGAKTWAALEKAVSADKEGAEAASVASHAGLKLKKSKRSVSELIVHCTATYEGKDYTVEQIRRMHTAPESQGGRGWSDIGYHYVIYRDGTVHNGRDVDISGAHCTDHNWKSIGIVYVGGCPSDTLKKGKDTRTPAQKEALAALLKELRKLYPKATIHGHNEFANKDCPCFNARNEYKNI